MTMTVWRCVCLMCCCRCSWILWRATRRARYTIMLAGFYEVRGRLSVLRVRRPPSPLPCRNCSCCRKTATDLAATTRERIGAAFSVGDAGVKTKQQITTTTTRPRLLACLPACFVSPLQPPPPQAFYVVFTTDHLYYAWKYNDTLPSTGSFSDGYGSAFINTLLTRCVPSLCCACISVLLWCFMCTCRPGETAHATSASSERCLVFSVVANAHIGPSLDQLCTLTTTTLRATATGHHQNLVCSFVTDPQSLGYV
jgi:hypothetical protein